jgi:hypothetical protein
VGFRVWVRFVCDVCCHTSSVGEEGSEGLASDDGIVVVAGHLLWGLYAVSVCARGGGGSLGWTGTVVEAIYGVPGRAGGKEEEQFHRPLLSSKDTPPNVVQV